jgi:hypothetical protein
MLVQCRSDADVSDMLEANPHLTKWSRRRAFFLEEWISADEASNGTMLQVVCDCSQTQARLVDVRKIVNLIPSRDAPTKRVSLPQVSGDHG